MNQWGTGGTIKRGHDGTVDDHRENRGWKIQTKMPTHNERDKRVTQAKTDPQRGEVSLATSVTVLIIPSILPTTQTLLCSLYHTAITHYEFIGV